MGSMSGRKGFTLVELLVIVTLLSLLAFLAFPRIAARYAPEDLYLQRGLTQLMNHEGRQSGIRLFVGKDGMLAAERRAIDPEGNLVWEKIDVEWFDIDGKWKVDPEFCYIFPDGTCSPWRLEYSKGDREPEVFFITVTCTVYGGSF